MIFSQRHESTRKTQICESCNEEKDLSHFYAYRRPNDCMECQQAEQEDEYLGLRRLNRPEMMWY